MPSLVRAASSFPRVLRHWRSVSFIYFADGWRGGFGATAAWLAALVWCCSSWCGCDPDRGNRWDGFDNVGAVIKGTLLVAFSGLLTVMLLARGLDVQEGGVDGHKFQKIGPIENRN